MSNDAQKQEEEITPEITSNDDAQQLNNEISTVHWVLNIEVSVRNQFPDTPTQSSQPNSTNTNSTKEENSTQKTPSIFSDIPRVVTFQHNINIHSLRQSTLPWQFVTFMTQRHGLSVSAYLEDIRAKEDLVWGYYQGLDSDIARNDSLEPDQHIARKQLFEELLLLNSCIIIFAILSFQTIRNGIKILAGTEDQTEQRYKEFNILYQHITSDNPRSVKCGMLDMDCQIPWFVVKAVYKDHSTLSEHIGTPIEKLAFSCFDDLYPGVHKSKVKGCSIGVKPPGGFKHLLHMFHWSRTHEEKYLVETRPLQPIESMDSFYIPSATELQLSETVYEKHAGIHVSYTDRRFLSGAMQLAPLHNFKYSKQTYQNLLRFERGYVKCGFPVTVYVACMWFLLRTEEDVTLLRAKGIVPSTQNDEEGVLGFLEYLKRKQRVLSKND